MNPLLLIGAGILAYKVLKPKQAPLNVNTVPENTDVAPADTGIVGPVRMSNVDILAGTAPSFPNLLYQDEVAFNIYAVNSIGG